METQPFYSGVDTFERGISVVLEFLDALPVLSEHEHTGMVPDRIVLSSSRDGDFQPVLEATTL